MKHRALVNHFVTESAAVMPGVAMPPQSSPLRSRLAWYGIPFLLLLVSILFQVASLSRALGNLYDEGLIVFGAIRVFHGQIPYRDFWTMYGPGQFYTLAALFKIASPSILVEQLWSVAVRAGIATMVFAWARRLDAGAYSYVSWLITLVMLAGTGFHGFPIFPALLFGLMSAYLVLASRASSRPMLALCGGGMLAGLAALFRHDMGFYIVVAELAALAWSGLVHGGRRLPRSTFIAWFVHDILPLALGTLLVVAPAAILLLIAVPLNDLWFNLFLVPATVYRQMRSLPFPGLPDPLALLMGKADLAAFSTSFSIYFPLVVGPVAIAYAVARSYSHRIADSEEAFRRFGILLLGLLILTLYLKGIVRISVIHLLQAIVPAIIVSFVLIARLGRSVPLLRVTALAAGAVIAAVLAAGPAGIVRANVAINASALRDANKGQPFSLRHALVQICKPEPGLERARCFVPRTEDALLTRFIQQRTQPEEPIYVGVAHHDRVFVNNILLYFLAARSSATKWHEVHPGIQTSAAVQAQMIDEFKASAMRYIILDSTWEYVREPNASALSSGVTLLDDYIRNHFDQIESFGSTSVWGRRGTRQGQPPG